MVAWNQGVVDAMKKIFSVFGVLTVSIILLTAGLSCSSENKISLGQEFALSVGSTVVISGEDLSLKFVEVTADSRCPTGVVCVWAGEAKCRMLVIYQGTESEVVFTQPGSSAGMQNLFQKYTVSFKLEPYPESGKQIESADYKLIATITK